MGRFEGKLAAVATDTEGGLYALDADGGGVFALAVAPDGVPGTFPERLSETGCFESLDPLTPAAGLIPYDINSPLWTDGEPKRRFLVLPPGETIEVDENGRWSFPVGRDPHQGLSAGAAPRRARQSHSARDPLHDPPR